MKRSARIQYRILYGSCRLLGRLPDRILYGTLAAAIRFVLYRVVRYRVGVARENLRRSFPEKSNEERRQIERRFYRHLGEVFVDTIKLASISRVQIMERMVYTNIAEHEERMQGRSWICAMSHFGSWELTINYVCQSDHRLLAVYHPLRNEAFDRYYYWVRSRFGTQPVAMRDIYREVIAAHQPGRQPVAVALIADQTPKVSGIDHWYRFLQQDTPFFAGTERMARRFGMPVAFLHVRQSRPHHYEAELRLIYDGREAVSEHEITRRYAQCLEEQIRETPHLWMWSHRRWKQTREGVAAFRASKGRSGIPSTDLDSL